MRQGEEVIQRNERELAEIRARLQAEHGRPAKDHEILFEIWRARRPAPSRTKLTDGRARRLKRVLKEYPLEDLAWLLWFVLDCDHSFSRWMRGENPRKMAYTDIDQIFRITYLDRRRDLADQWLCWCEREVDDLTARRQAAGNDFTTSAPRSRAGNLVRFRRPTRRDS